MNSQVPSLASVTCQGVYVGVIALNSQVRQNLPSANPTPNSYLVQGEDSQIPPVFITRKEVLFYFITRCTQPNVAVAQSG